MPRFATFVRAGAALGLDEVVARLSARPAVLAIVLLGSTATGPGPDSDLDLLLVLDDGPAFDVEFSWVAGRPTDVILVSRAFLQALSEASSPSAEGQDVARWIAAGRIAWVRDPAMETALEAAARQASTAVPAVGEQFMRWVEANFQLVKLRRHAAAASPGYRAALELALLPAIHACVRDHLCLRGEAWQGEKAALAWLAREDPAFLDLLHAALHAGDLDARMQAYDALVERACEPVGGVWPPGHTSGGWRLAAAPGRFEALVRGTPSVSAGGAER